jgi:hypothetical protein
VIKRYNYSPKVLGIASCNSKGLLVLSVITIDEILVEQVFQGV